MNDSDFELVKQAKAGVQSAFTKIVAKHQKDVKRHLSRYFSNQSDIDDVSQEVFIKVFRHINNFRQDSKFSTWLYTIVSNTAKTYATSNGRMKFVSQKESDIILENLMTEDSGETHLECAELLESIAERKEYMFQRMQELAENMPFEFAQVLQLAEVDNLPYRNIAQTLDIPEGTVKSRLFRAREILKEKGVCLDAIRVQIV